MNILNLFKKKEVELKFKRKKVFSSIEVCMLLAKELGIQENSGANIDVDWNFRKNAKDNFIEVYY
tara:strand:- start:341 stop:535 length:195 start_codon:yes stop_codon:yes gene_type:complete